MKIGVIFLAGGNSVRMGSGIQKAFLPLLDKPASLYSYDILAPFAALNEMVVVTNPEHHKHFPQSTRFASPGLRRQDSLDHGLQQLSPSVNLVFVHDAARPLLLQKDVQALLDLVDGYSGIALGKPVSNALKRVSASGIVIDEISREHLWESYTPQLVNKNHLLDGLSHAKKMNLTVPDELSLLHQMGHKTKIIPASFPNIKLTYQTDIPLVEALLKLIPTS